MSVVTPVSVHTVLLRLARRVVTPQVDVHALLSGYQQSVFYTA